MAFLKFDKLRFSKFKEGLAKTRERIGGALSVILPGKLDEEAYEALEEALVLSDAGMETAMELVEDLRERRPKDGREAEEILAVMMAERLPESTGLVAAETPPAVYLFMGVNGVGKTTTIAKITARLQREGKSVMLAAGDTFRAAAVEQLQVWGERLGVSVIAQAQGSDAAAVVFDAIRSARTRGVDVLLVDTAGRLHSSVNLMAELEKIGRILERECPGAPHESLLILDATTGQNGVRQIASFHEALPLTGLILTKLDGTAKGGVVLSACSEVPVPIKFIGVGEKMEDLVEFEPLSFCRALLNLPEEPPAQSMG